jgi:hypothetical protein
MSIRKRIVTIGLLWSPFIFGQESSTLFFMQTLPQSNFINPAVQIPCKVYVGMPLLSSIHFNYSNTWLTYNDIISRTRGDSLNLNINRLLTKPGTIQDVTTELHINLLSFGFLYKEYYFNFSITDKVNAGIKFPTNAFQLVLMGNRPLEGELLDLSGLGAHTMYYREWALGVSKVVNSDLTLGAKAKVLFGKADITVNSPAASLTTELPIFYWDVYAKYKFRASPIVINRDATGNVTSASLPNGVTWRSFLLNRQNKGLALDFGLIWKVNDDVTISGSLLDVGVIRWAYSPVSFNVESKVAFNGIVFNNSNKVVQNISQLADSLANLVPKTSQNKAFYTALAPQLYLGGTYKLNNWANVGLLSRNEYFYGKLNSSVTASVNSSFKKYLTGSLSWSYINNSIANIGAGVGARTPNFGFYAISDNVYGLFKYKSANLVNARFGLYFLFGCSKKKDPNSVNSCGCEWYQQTDSKKEKIEQNKKEKNNYLFKSKKKK